MGFETLSRSSSGEKAESIYYNYRRPMEEKEGINYGLLKKDIEILGYYLHSYVNPKSQYGTVNHVIIDDKNIHHVLPGATDFDKSMKDCQIGAKTKLIFNGKKSFETSNGKTAQAWDWIVMQDKDDTVQFTGDKYALKIAKDGDTIYTPKEENKDIKEESNNNPKEDTKANADVTAEDIPF